MESFVDRIGSIKAKNFNKERLEDIEESVKTTIETNVAKISRLTDGKESPEHEGSQGPFSKDRLIFYFLVLKYTFSGVLMPLLDMGSDIATAVTHFVFDDLSWGLLTLIFVWLPGFVCALAVAVRGLRKRFSAGRLVNYLVILIVFPFLYPFAQILVNGYMLYLMIVSRSRDVIRVMGHDVKQFKSLEGFLESGPQFVLQSYILLRGEQQGYEDMEKAEAFRIFTLVVSISLSFVSLSKTGFDVNVPDPDEARKSMQYPENSKRIFPFTSAVFHVVCVLFRVSCLAYFFAVFREYTILIIFLSLATNLVILRASGASYTTSLLLGAVSIFMPNGYLLYNFAATFPIDFTFRGSRRFLLWHMCTITPAFLVCVVVILVCGVAGSTWLEDRVENTFLTSIGLQLGLDFALLSLGLASLGLCYLHWRYSVVPLYRRPTPLETTEEEEDAVAAAGVEKEKNGSGVFREVTGQS